MPEGYENEISEMWTKKTKIELRVLAYMTIEALFVPSSHAFPILFPISGESIS